ncbi:hypothetical protein VIGAN_04096300, partial [Vigna angularis var. angularis]
MWETLGVTHEGGDEIGCAKTNTLIMEENNSSSSSSTTSSMGDSDEQAYICLVVNDDTGSQVSTSSDSDDSDHIDEDELHEIYRELLIESEKLDLAHKKLKK